MHDLQYPVGLFEHEGPVTDRERERWIAQIAVLPGQVRQTLAGRTDADLDVPYRLSGWTARQVVHHLADSHLNAFIRFKLALTEDAPTIRPYAEERWAELPDVRAVPVEVALDFLTLLHVRWVALLRALPEEAWSRVYVHPESGPIALGRAVGQYAWHGRHHLAHLTIALAHAPA